MGFSPTIRDGPRNDPTSGRGGSLDRKEPNAWFVERLASTSAWIIARECVEKFGDLKNWQSVVGTGPWMLERYEPTKLKFVRNPNYYQPGAPYVDAVELTVDPDPKSAFEAF